MTKVITQYYSVAIVDLRMDGYSIDGFTVMDQIMTANPYAKIIIVSAYMSEYMPRISTYISKGAVLAISEKKDMSLWIPELGTLINDYFNKDLNPIAVQILENLFATAKNESNTAKKGRLFEEFVVGLFQLVNKIEKKVVELIFYCTFAAVKSVGREMATAKPFITPTLFLLTFCCNTI